MWEPGPIGTTPAGIILLLCPPPLEGGGTPGYQVERQRRDNRGPRGVRRGVGVPSPLPNGHTNVAQPSIPRRNPTSIFNRNHVSFESCTDVEMSTSQRRREHDV